LLSCFLGCYEELRQEGLTSFLPSLFKASSGGVMQVIVLASQKGGSGKTTLSGHLAVEAQRGDKVVVCVDTDAQGGLTDWWNARNLETPALSTAGTGGLKALLEKLAKAQVDYVVIDTPGQVSAEAQATIRLADIVVIPVMPSPHDLRAVGKTVDTVVDTGRPMLFVVNRATQRARLTSEAAVVLSQHGTVAPVTIHSRTDFAASMIDGRTTNEIDPTGKSAAEVRELWAYILKRLDMEKRSAAAA
jgi:chromosome partitioning protein